MPTASTIEPAPINPEFGGGRYVLNWGTASGPCGKRGIGSDPLFSTRGGQSADKGWAEMFSMWMQRVVSV
jgi:hypothetical protein